jgi:hypothetical protein
MKKLVSILCLNYMLFNVGCKDISFCKIKYFCNKINQSSNIDWFEMVLNVLFF